MEREMQEKIETLELLWYDLGVPPNERNYWASTYFGDCSEESLDVLADLIVGLEEHNESTYHVRKAIHEREKCLEKLRNVSKLFVGRRPPIRFIQTEIALACSQLREASLSVVARVVAWRAQLSRPLPFVWNNENYILKMKEDMHDFVDCVFAPYLPCFVVDNPLLILPRSRYEKGQDLMRTGGTERGLPVSPGGRRTPKRPSTAPSRHRPAPPRRPSSAASERRSNGPRATGGDLQSLRRLQAAEAIIKGEPKLMETLELEKRVLLERGEFLLMLAGSEGEEPVFIPARSTRYRRNDATPRDREIPNAWDGTPSSPSFRSSKRRPQYETSENSDGVAARTLRLAEEEEAARRIQAVYRGHTGRKKVTDLRLARKRKRRIALRSEASQRAAEAEDEASTRRLKRLKSNAVLAIQTKFRSHMARSSIERARAELDLAERAQAVKQQMEEEAEEEARRHAEEKERQTAAALALQSRYRGHRLRCGLQSEQEVKALENEISHKMELRKAEDEAELERQRAELEEERLRLHEQSRAELAAAEEAMRRAQRVEDEEMKAQLVSSARREELERMLRAGGEAGRLTHAVLTIQSYLRSLAVRGNYLQEVERQTAATVIQSRYRGHRALTERRTREAQLLAERERGSAAVVIQSRLRGLLLREDRERELAEQEEVLRRMEAAREGPFAEEEGIQRAVVQDSGQEAAAVRIQSTYRGHRARRHVRGLRESASAEERERTMAATLIQARFRADVIRQRYMHGVREGAAATKIQALYRGHRTRSRSHARSHKEHDAAATRIQAVYRGRRGRARAKKLQRSLITERMKAEEAEENAKRLKIWRKEDAVRVIQARFRAKEARQYLAEEMNRIPDEDIVGDPDVYLDGSQSLFKDTEESTELNLMEALEEEQSVEQAEEEQPEERADEEYSYDDVVVEKDNGGSLHVRLVRATDLPVTSKTGVIYPYCQFSIISNSGRELGIPPQSSQRGRTKEHVWNVDFTFDLPVDESPFDLSLGLWVFDRKKKSRNHHNMYKEIGHRVVGLNTIETNGKPIPMWLPLAEGASAPEEDLSIEIYCMHDPGKARAPEVLGSVILDVATVVWNSPIDAWLTLDQRPPDDSRQLRLQLNYRAEDKDDHGGGGDTGYISVQIKEAKGLSTMDGSPLNCYCSLRFEDQRKETKLKSSSSPRWNELFVFEMPLPLKSVDLGHGAVLIETMLQPKRTRTVTRVRRRKRPPLAKGAGVAAVQAQALPELASAPPPRARARSRARKGSMASATAERGEVDKDKLPPAFKIDSLSVHADPESPDTLELCVRLKNMDDVPRSLRNYKLRVTPIDDEGCPLPGYTAREVGQFSKRLIEPGTERKLRLPWPEDVPYGPVVVTIALDD